MPKLQGNIELKRYSKYFNLEYKTTILEGKIKYCCIIQRKFVLDLPPNFTYMKHTDKSEEVLKFVKPLEATISFYRILKSAEKRRKGEKGKKQFYEFQQEKKLKNDLSKIKDLYKKKIACYYARICRSKFNIQNISDEDHFVKRTLF